MESWGSIPRSYGLSWAKSIPIPHIETYFLNLIYGLAFLDASFPQVFPVIIVATYNDALLYPEQQRVKDIGRPEQKCQLCCKLCDWLLWQKCKFSTLF